MEEIISTDEIVPEVMGNLNQFAKLQCLQLFGLRNLKSIYWKPLPFPHPKEMIIDLCYELKKLPLDSNSARDHNIVICGNEDWWEEFQWDDEAIRNAFLPCFKQIAQQ